MTRSIKTNNRTKFDTDAIVRLLRGALRATSTGRSTRYVSVDIGWTRKPSSWAGVVWTRAGGGRRDLNVRFSLRNEDHTAADVHALAGQTMEALDTPATGMPPIPFWQRDTRWVDDLTLTRKQARTSTPAERSAEREAHARKMLARAQADAQRVQARVERWSEKVRYYDRKQEAR